MSYSGVGTYTMCPANGRDPNETSRVEHVEVAWPALVSKCNDLNKRFSASETTLVTTQQPLRDFESSLQAHSSEFEFCLISNKLVPR
jgi:hypothetical protein